MTPKQLLFLVVGVYLLFPVHELGHYWVARKYDVPIQDVSWAPVPRITVNEFDFKYPQQLAEYYLEGMFLPLTLAYLYRVIWHSKKYSVSYIWITLAPVSALTDFENLFRAFGGLDYLKWVHLGLGMFLMYRIERITEIS